MTDISWPCSKCDYTANSYQELEKHMKDHHQKAVVTPKKDIVLEQAIQKFQKKKEPIELEYTYKGNCPKCGSRVETIELELDKKTRVTLVAWCSMCKKQIETREEAKLDYKPPKEKNEKA